MPRITWEISENFFWPRWVRDLDPKAVQLTYGLQEGNGLILATTQGGDVVDGCGSFLVDLPQRTSKSRVWSDLQVHRTIF